MSDTKECRKCHIIKPLTEFYYHNDKPIGQCKECVRMKSMEYHYKNLDKIKGIQKEWAVDYRQRNKRTPDGWFTKTYGRIKRDNRVKFNLSLPFSKDEFYDWIESNYKDKFKKLFKDYVDSDCDKYLNPSIDRIDDYKSYTFDNMQLITWRENDKKGSSGVKNKVSCAEVGKQYCSKTVLQYNENKELLMTFSSTHEVGRVLGIDSSLIAKACRNYIKGKSWYAKGYFWRYKEYNETEQNYNYDIKGEQNE